MRVLTHGENLAEPVCLLIGNYDGVHLGHQALIRKARELAEVHGLKTAVLSFSPHPLKLLAPERAPRLIQTPHQKKALLAYHKVDYYIEQPFTTTLSRMSPASYISKLREQVSFRFLIVGANFRFGHQQAGDVETLKNLGRRFGFETIGEQVIVTDSERVSSSRIRDHLSEGRVDLAGDCLGRPYVLEGEITAGDKLGRKLEAPTANMIVENELLPKHGVYASWSRVEGKWHRAITNIGVRPTLERDGVRIETHFFDFSGDAYGKSMLLALSKFIREEKKFGGLDELRGQIHRDFQARLAMDDTTPPHVPMFPPPASGR